MSITRDISSALEGRLNTLPSLPSVAWPNVKFTPTNSETYLRVTNLRSDTSTISQDSTEQHTGIFQVDVFAPYNGGSGVAENLADSIADHFAANRTLIKGVAEVYIRNISVEVGATFADRHVIPVSINYDAYHKR